MIDFERVWSYNMSVNNQRRSKGGIGMLLDERLEQIVCTVNERGSITSQELAQIFNVSESTIRRDITTLAEDNRIVRVYGGAMSLTYNGNADTDSEVNERRTLCGDEKRKIAEYAASLIKDNDFVYIDAGTTTEYMIEYIRTTGAAFVTNAVSHAVQLAKKGLNVYIIGGQVKSITEAIVDSDAIMSLGKYNFTKGFFGTNGIHHKRGLTTPDIREADVKRFAISRCREKFVLCDSSKFGMISKATFAQTSDVTIITDGAPAKFLSYKYDVREVK